MSAALKNPKPRLEDGSFDSSEIAVAIDFASTVLAVVAFLQFEQKQPLLVQCPNSAVALVTQASEETPASPTRELVMIHSDSVPEME